MRNHVAVEQPEWSKRDTEVLKKLEQRSGYIQATLLLSTTGSGGRDANRVWLPGVVGHQSMARSVSSRGRAAADRGR